MFVLRDFFYVLSLPLTVGRSGALKWNLGMALWRGVISHFFFKLVSKCWVIVKKRFGNAKKHFVNACTHMVGGRKCFVTAKKHFVNACLHIVNAGK